MRGHVTELLPLKKRKIDRTGQERTPQYRTVPVPAALIESLDLVFNLRARQRRPGANRDAPLWHMSRPAAWRLIKREPVPCHGFYGILRGRAGGVGPGLPSEAEFLAGQFNAKRIGLAHYVLLLRPIKA